MRGWQAKTDWVRIGPDGVRLGATLECFATLLIASLPLSLALLVMLRHTARLHPTMVGMMGGLASAGVAATALSLFHELDATVMVLVWNLGAAALIVALGGIFGRRIFGWTAQQRLDVV
jgi:hypothetical protein